jgi:hypothetical protein
VTDELDALRSEVAATHGLGADAVPFLAGTALAEIEASAGLLASLVASSGAEEQTAPLAALFTHGAARKAERQRALIQALHGRQPQARDELGRWARSFDGGARRPPPSPGPTHEEWLAQLLLDARAHAL